MGTIAERMAARLTEARAVEVELQGVPGVAVRVRELSPMDAVRLQGVLSSVLAEAMPATAERAQLNEEGLRLMIDVCKASVIAGREPGGGWEPMTVGEHPGPDVLPVDLLSAHDIAAIWAAAIGAGRRAAVTARGFCGGDGVVGGDAGAGGDGAPGPLPALAASVALPDGG